MKTNDVLSEEISERDEGALKYLEDIKWCKFDDHKGFKLEFFFDSNPYFKNTVLTKTYHMIDYKKSILEKAIGTEIEWLPGKSLTQKVMKMKREKGAKPRIITKTCESFFNFFTPPVVPEDDDYVDEEAVEEFQNLLEQDYEIGSTIREKIIPNAVSWFTGEAAVKDEFDMRGDVYEEDEDEEDDEDEDGEGKSRKKKIGRTIGEGQQAERPPDCKQQ